MAILVVHPPEEPLEQGTVLDELPWEEDPAPLGIVLTNSCDLEWDKAAFVLVAALVPASPVLQQSNEFQQAIKGIKEETLSRKKWEGLERTLAGIIHNRDIRRFFFLDAEEALGLQPLLVDFQRLVTVEIGTAQELTRMAKLPSPDREKLIVHFASYVSRIGTQRHDRASTARLVRIIASPYRGAES